MAYQLWSQDIFSKGELSPFMYSRATVNEYGNGLKTATNVLTYPTGAAGKRFGTLFQSIVSTIPVYNEFYFQTFMYLNEATYQFIFTPFLLTIYLEGIAINQIATIIDGQSAFNLSSTVLSTTFRVTGANFKPQDIIRFPNSPMPITGVIGNQFTLTTPPLGVGLPLPIVFTTAGSLPVTTPQVKVGVTYFGWTDTATSMSIYNTPTDAKFQTNPIILSTAGVLSNITMLNGWSIGNTVFKNLPFYDFNGKDVPYDAITFTPSAVTGNAVVTLSAPYAPLTTAYIGGAFFGGGGSSRIINVISTTVFHIAIKDPFDSVDPIQGNLVLLAEPAWSVARGFPIVCSSYQNRALFANTASLPNGFWASTINDYSDFGDLTNDDDDAISWYPTSNNINFIRFIVPYRSITVHTNSGIYSSPLSDVVAITPSNFTLQLQDSTPADVLQPEAIDNQILVLSGDDAHQMLWDGINNAYTSDIVSVISEQLIRDPQDETAFADLHRAGSRFVFIINLNGTMAAFQTLLSQNVSGFAPQLMEQSYGNALFRQAASDSNGRCWFVIERQIAQAVAPILVTNFTATTLEAVGTNFSTTEPIAVTFVLGVSLPTSTPQLELLTYYWAIGIDANNFSVYLTEEDARAGENPIVFSNFGTGTNVVSWPLVTTFTLEELTAQTFLDCAVYYNSTATDTIATGTLFNAQAIKMVGDGFGFEAIGVNDEVTFEAHGSPVEVSEAYIGFPINTVIEPMPLTISQGPSAKNTSLTKPTHIRTVRFMFNNTIGGEINGVPIALEPFSLAQIGDPPSPARGVMELSVMKGWDDFKNPTYTITHSDPFDIQLLGVYYSVEV